MHFDRRPGSCASCRAASVLGAGGEPSRRLATSCIEHGSPAGLARGRSLRVAAVSWGSAAPLEVRKRVQSRRYDDLPLRSGHDLCTCYAEGTWRHPQRRPQPWPQPPLTHGAHVATAAAVHTSSDELAVRDACGYLSKPYVPHGRSAAPTSFVPAAKFV